jgi:hypothetical protein
VLIIVYQFNQFHQCTFSVLNPRYDASVGVPYQHPHACVIAICFNTRVNQSTIFSFISSLFPCSSGAYIALAFAGKAL